MGISLEKDLTQVFNCARHCVNDVLAVLRTGVEEDIREGVISVATQFRDATQGHRLQPIVDTGGLGVQRGVPPNWQELHSTLGLQ